MKKVVCKFLRGVLAVRLQSTSPHKILKKICYSFVAWMMIFSICATPMVQAFPLVDEFKGVLRPLPQGGVKVAFPCVPQEPVLSIDMQHIKNILTQSVLNGEKEIIKEGIGIRRLGMKEGDLESEMKIFMMDLLLQEIWGPEARNPYRELVLFEDEAGQRLLFLLEKVQARNFILFRDYIRSAPYKSAGYFDEVSFQRHFLASLLINPSDAHGETFVVDPTNKRLWAVGAYQQIGAPIIKTQGRGQRNYELATLNALYVSEFYRNQSRATPFMSDNMFRADVVKPFLEKSPQAILLGWLMHEPVRKYGRIMGNEMPGSSMLDHFIGMAHGIAQHLRMPVTPSPKSLLQSLQGGVWEAYGNLHIRFPHVQEKEREGVVHQICQHLWSSPQPYINSDTLSDYDPYRVSSTLSGSSAFEVLLRHTIIPLAAGDEDQVDEGLMRNVANILNQAAGVYNNRYADVSRVIDLVLRHSSAGDLSVIKKGMFRILNSGFVTPGMLQFAVRLGFPMNDPGEAGYTLLHEAVRRNNTVLLNALKSINGSGIGVVLDTERLSVDIEEPQTALDFAVGHNEAMFQDLVTFGAGARLQNPRRALESYLELQRRMLLSSNLKDAFRKLAQRHQEFRWLVVLEEVFPRLRDANGIPIGADVSPPLSSLPPMGQLLQELGERLSPPFILQELTFTFGERRTIRLADEDARNLDLPDVDKQESYIRKLETLKTVAERNGFSAMNQDFDSCLSAAIELGFEGDRERLTAVEKEEIEVTRLEIGAHIVKNLMTPYDRTLHNNYEAGEETKHLAAAMRLTAIQNALKTNGRTDVKSLSGYYAAPLLAKYLRARDMRNNNLDNISIYENFWRQFQRSMHTSAHEADLLAIINRSYSRMEKLEEALRHVYRRVTTPDTIIDMAENGLRRFPKDVRLNLMPNGLFQRTMNYGLCAVRKISLGQLGRESLLGDDATLYVKKFPQMPGLEAAASRLILGVAGCGATYSDLTNIDGDPYLISQGFGGDGPEAENLLERLRRDPDGLVDAFKGINERRTLLLILATILVSPEDGKFDNYLLSPLADDPGEVELVGFDNDHSFVPPVGSERTRRATGESRRVETNSIIFSMKKYMTTVIPEDVRKVFLEELKDGSFLEKWLLWLQKLDESYERLFPSTDRRQEIFNRYLSCIGVPLSEQMVMGVYDRLSFMQEQFANNIDVTPADLLRRTIPVLAARYSRFWEKDQPFDLFLRDPDLQGIPTALLTSYYTSNRLVVQKFVNDPLPLRLAAAKALFGSVGKNIKIIEDVVAGHIPRTSEILQSFRCSEYQKKRFMRGMDWASFDAEEQRKMLKMIQDPENPVNWVELTNCSVVSDVDFYVGDVPDGDTHKFILQNLVHLSVVGCKGLTAPMVSDFLNKGSHLTFLDISGTKCNLGIGGNGKPVPLRTTLRVLKMNGLIPDVERKITILPIGNRDSLVPELQELELDGLTDRKSVLELGDAPELRRLSLRNLGSLTDETLDALLFETDKKGNVRYEEEPEADRFDATTQKNEVIKRFPKLRELHVSGTSVTLPEIREFLLQIDSKKVRDVKERIRNMSSQDAEMTLQLLSVDVRKIMSVGGLSKSTAYFFKNVGLGILWDVWGIAQLFKKLNRMRINKQQREAANVQQEESQIASQKTQNGDIGLSDVAGAANVGLRVADIPAAFFGISNVGMNAVKVVPIVGWAIGGAIWVGRAAYWEHKRVEHNIECAQIMTGMTLRAAMKKLYGSGGTESKLLRFLNLNGKNLGDAGLAKLFEPDEGGAASAASQ